MKTGLFCLILLFFTCSSSDDSTDKDTIVESDNINITYRGFYQVFFEEPYQQDIYTNITVTPIVDEISPTETINLLEINAYSSNETRDIIRFRVLTNSIGNNALYDHAFSFRSHGATYYSSNLNFEVLTNNDLEFSANFSGELDHWYEGEQRYVYLDISSGFISISH